MFVPIIKPVSTLCNIACGYCYHSWNRIEKRQLMSFNVLEKIIRGFAELKQDKTRFIWHGGEPTLAGIDFFCRAIDFQRKYFSAEKRIVNSIQTNGINIDTDWCKFLQTNHFSVGISIDGPKSIHDFYRKFRNQSGTLDRVMESVKLLKKFNVPIGPVSVVSKASVNCAKIIFDFLYENQMYKMNFSPAADFSDDGKLLPYSITSREWGNFLIELFDVWFVKNDARVKIQLLDSFLQGLIGGRATACCCRKDCSEFISFDNDGGCYFCGRFLGHSDLKLGHINNSTVLEIVDGESRAAVSKKIQECSVECLRCNWRTICNGGCPSHRYALSSKSFANKFYFCEAHKMVLKHMKEKIGCYKELF